MLALIGVDGMTVDKTYVTTGEVTTLEHELGDHAVEGRALVAEALLASAESAEVGGSLGDDIVEQLEGDAAGLFCTDCQLRVIGDSNEAGGEQNGRHECRRDG